MYINNNPTNFTQREIAAALQVWNRAAISLLDIRHNLIAPREALCSYRLPANAFLYASGKAEISLNDTPYHIERFGLFHGGKGTVLSIEPKSDWMEYYMVLYKAEEPSFHRREFGKLMAQTNPFRQQYGFSPSNAIFIAELLRNMYEKWKGPTPLNLFYGKSAFYQLVYAVYEELEHGLVAIFEPDSIAMAKRYLDEHFGNVISMQELCVTLGISYSYFYKSFKYKMGISPQEYLIRVRLSSAKRCLEDSDMPIRMIAETCGFADERSFYRLFAKHFGLSPNTHRQNSPLCCNDNTIGNLLPFPYNEDCQVRLGELKGEGATFMLRQMRSKAVVAAALSIMLLMSACGTAPANSGGSDSTPTSSVAMQESQTRTQGSDEEGTRVVQTPSGDVEVPTNPKRIIALYTSIGDMLALGVRPIAAVEYNINHPNYAQEMQGVSVLTDYSAESLMAYEPDLLLLTPDVDVEKLSKIAPVVVVPYTEMTMDERVTLVGEVLNKQEEAKQALAEFHQKVAKSKEQLMQAGVLDRTISIFEPANSGYWVYGNKWGFGGGILYDQLGFNAPALVEENIIDAEQWREVSLEVLSDYAGDYILFLGDLTSLEGTPIWESLPPVQEDRVIHFDSTLFLDSDLSSSHMQLELLMQALLDK